MANDKKIPEPYDKNAPSFSDEEPKKLLQFFDHMERMMEIAGTVDGAKNTLLLRYVDRQVAEQWRKFASFKGPYTKFKNEILENYPEARNSERGSIKKLKNILSEFDSEEIGLNDSEELMKLVRAMNVEVDKLMTSGLITDREAVPLFLDKLTPGLREQVIFRIDFARENEKLDPLADEEAAPEADTEEKGYTFQEVIAQARKLSRKHDTRQEYMSTIMGGRSKGKGRSLTPERAVKSEESGGLAAKMLEEIKLTLVNMRDRMDVSDKKHKEDFEQIRQLYKSVPGRVTGSADAQTMPPRQEVRFGRPPGMDLCHYCRTTGHFIGACPRRLQHLAEGKIKAIGTRDFFMDGTPIPLGGSKPRSQIVDEFRVPTSSVNILSASSFVQAAELPGMTADDWAAYEEDNGEYGYYDPQESQNAYDPREEEIHALRIEQQNQQNLIRQLIQHHQVPRRGVQPPPKVQTPAQVDQNMLATVLAAVQHLNANSGNEPGQEAQFAVGTRANPSRTGNGAGQPNL
ncbi:hypothetical protein FB45DRAFT_1036408 [Roridomyces roridus]|uniref:CCHC-type domain-containing protein n=1 Tax=Roridomyces roridus TaxID=1738132 RepID=A0AAD7FB77_9AGAR|nr:hypothetical protein FB45DRAFT_1036408 [Roridomyces roridus]